MNDDQERYLIHQLNLLNRNTQELLWSNIFHDSIKGCKWLPNNDFAINPGRWAVGYNYFYVVFRILDEMQPKSILELGAGQSSKLIGHYIKTRENVDNYKHILVEHNKEFADILKKRIKFSSSTKVAVIDITKSEFNMNRRGGYFCIYCLQDGTF